MTHWVGGWISLTINTVLLPHWPPLCHLDTHRTIKVPNWPFPLAKILWEKKKSLPCSTASWGWWRGDGQSSSQSWRGYCSHLLKRPIEGAQGICARQMSAVNWTLFRWDLGSAKMASLTHFIPYLFEKRQFLCIAKWHNPATADDTVQFNPQLRLRRVGKLSQIAPSSHTQDLTGPERERWTRRHHPPFISWSITLTFGLSCLDGPNDGSQEVCHGPASPAPK